MTRGPTSPRFRAASCASRPSVRPARPADQPAGLGDRRDGADLNRVSQTVPSLAPWVPQIGQARRLDVPLAPVLEVGKDRLWMRTGNLDGLVKQVRPPI